MEVLFICLIIFIIRATVVCFGTFRIVCIVKDKRVLATFVAFIEVLIWFIVFREVLVMDEMGIIVPIVYSLGFATGTYMGILLSNKLISGYLTINAISNKITDADLLKIKQAGFGISFLPMNDNKKFIIVQIDKKHFDNLKSILKTLDEKIFIMVKESAHVYNGFIK